MLVAGGAGTFFWLNHSSSQESASHKTYTHHWGAVVRAFALDKPGTPYSKQHLVQQFDYLKELGVTDVRANAEVNETINDDYVSLANERGLTATLILETPRFFEEETHDSMFAYGKKIAERYKGKVAFYQLGNEASGVAVKSGFSGSKTTDYDETKYKRFKELVRGLSEGIKSSDPNAKRIISAHWLGVGVIDRLVADKVEFEVIGWDWYSDMGNDMIKIQDGQTINIPQYLSKYNKEFWIAELNHREGSKNGAAVQADFLQTFVLNAMNHPEIKAIFVFPLTDQCGDLDKDYGKMGLVELTKNVDGTCTITGKKKAFDTYKNLIQHYQ